MNETKIIFTGDPQSLINAFNTAAASAAKFNKDMETLQKSLISSAEEQAKAEQAKNNKIKELNEEQYGSQKTLAGKIKDAWNTAYEDIKQTAKNAASSVYEDIKKASASVYEDVKKSASSAWSTIGEWAGKAGEYLTGVIEKTAAVSVAFWAWGAAGASVVANIFTGVTILIGAYKSLEFIIGLFTGSSYKSEHIDALIAERDAVENLRKSLQLSTADTQATRGAMQALGISSSDVTTVYDGVRTSLRNNTDELTRLGVKYKDANGNILDQRTILENAKGVLDQYTEGWDRNQAAVAIGMGSYEQIGNTLKITDAELQRAKEGLDKYHLGIGKETNEAVDEYQKAMLSFKNESKLMADGLSRAISDQIMPAFTSLANFFSGGWPRVVDIFRYSMATVTSLLYGLKTSFDIVVDSVKAGFGVVGDIFVGLAKASIAALKGDFSGAKDALAGIWTDVKTTASKTWAEMQADAERSNKAMKMAWAFDGREIGTKAAVKGKTWVAAVKDDADDADKAVKMLGASEKYILTALLTEYKNYYESAIFEADRWLMHQQEIGTNELVSTTGYYDAKDAALWKYYDDSWNAIEKSEILEAEKTAKLKELNANYYKTIEDDLKKQEKAEIDYRKKNIEVEAAMHKTINQYSNEAVAADIALIKKKYVEASRWTDKTIDLTKAEAQEIRNLQITALNASEKFYSNIFGYSKVAYQKKLQLIEFERQDNIRLYGDIRAANQKAVDDTMRAYIQMAQKSDNWTTGVKAGLLQITQAHETWGNTAYAVTQAFTNSAGQQLQTNLFSIWKGNISDIRVDWTAMTDDFGMTLTKKLADIIKETAANKIILYFTSTMESSAAGAGTGLLGSAISSVSDWLFGSSPGNNDMYQLGNYDPEGVGLSFSGGGWVPGTALVSGNSAINDMIKGWLSPNEYVVDRETTAAIAGKGRSGDTLLAHINMAEAQLLKALGGKGTVNPQTGILEFSTADSEAWDKYSQIMAAVTSGKLKPSDFPIRIAGPGSSSGKYSTQAWAEYFWPDINSPVTQNIKRTDTTQDEGSSLLGNLIGEQAAGLVSIAGKILATTYGGPIGAMIATAGGRIGGNLLQGNDMDWGSIAKDTAITGALAYAMQGLKADTLIGRIAKFMTGKALGTGLSTLAYGNGESSGQSGTTKTTVRMEDNGLFASLYNQIDGLYKDKEFSMSPFAGVRRAHSGYSPAAPLKLANNEMPVIIEDTESILPETQVGQIGAKLNQIIALSAKSTKGNEYHFHFHGTIIDKKAVNEFAEMIYPRLKQLEQWGH